MEINGVEVEFDIDEELMVVAAHVILVKAAIGDETCVFEIGMNETAEGSGIFRLEESGFDRNEESQRDCIQWLQDKTGCDEDEAVENMDELLNDLDLSDRYKENKRGDDVAELFDKLDGAKSVLSSGITMNDVGARVFATEEGEYLGTIKVDGEVFRLISLSKKEFAALSDEANGYQYGSHACWKALMDGINALADLPRDEDDDEDDED